MTTFICLYRNEKKIAKKEYRFVFGSRFRRLFEMRNKFQYDSSASHKRSTLIVRFWYNSFHFFAFFVVALFMNNIKLLNFIIFENEKKKLVAIGGKNPFVIFFSPWKWYEKSKKNMIQRRIFIAVHYLLLRAIQRAQKRTHRMIWPVRRGECTGNRN